MTLILWFVAKKWMLLFVGEKKEVYGFGKPQVIWHAKFFFYLAEQPSASCCGFTFWIYAQ